MKRMVCLFAVLLICLGLVSPAYAAGSVFVPSVTYKETPPVQDAVLNIPKDVIEKLPEEYKVDTEKLEQVLEDEHLQEDLQTCVVVTSIQQAKDQTTDIYQESRDLLLELYEQIAETSQIVVDKNETDQKEPDQTVTTPDQTVTEPEQTEEASAENMKLIFHGEEFVIREMVDVSLRKGECVEMTHLHDEVLEIEETTISVDFDLGVAKDVEVVVLTYRDGKWSQVEKVTNNGDGTITCIFEHFCPVIFCVPASTLEQKVPEEPTLPTAAPAQIPDYPLVPLILLIAAFVLFLLLVFLRHKRKKEEENT